MLLSCTCWHIDLYLSSVIVLCQYLKELSAQTACYTTFMSQVNAQNFFLMNEHQVGTPTLSWTNPRCSNVCRHPGILTPKRLSIHHTERCFLPAVGADFLFYKRNQAKKHLLDRILNISAPRLTPSLLAVLKKITLDRWRNQLLCKHKIFCFIWGQFYLFNRPLS